jgi:hypothetical protein
MERLLYSESAKSADSPSRGFRVGRFTAQLTMPDCDWSLVVASTGHSYLDNVVVFARRKVVPGRGCLTTRRGQLITTTKGLDVRPESGSSRRSR